MKEPVTVRFRSLSTTLALALVLGLSPSARAQSAVPEKLDIPTTTGPFSVILTDAAGVESELFNHRKLPVFDINFILAMSVSDKYPVTITLIQDEEELQLYKGTLEGGYYRFPYALSALPKSNGTVQAKVILKTRIYTGKKHSGESSLNYQKWEGTYRIGYR